jgi:hypothetical protein
VNSQGSGEIQSLCVGGRPSTFHKPHEFRARAPHRKRRSTAVLQDAGALATGARTSARFWSTPPLRRFGFPWQVHGPNAWHQLRGLSMNRRLAGQISVTTVTYICPLGFIAPMQAKSERGLSMNRRRPRQVLECASLVALWQWRRAESAKGLAQSKTLPRDPQVPGPGARDSSRRNAGTADPCREFQGPFATQPSCGLKSALRSLGQRAR